MVLPLYASLEKLDETLLEAAADLGCPPLAGVLAGDASRCRCRASSPARCLCFIPATGEFVIPDLLGGSDTLMIGKTLWTSSSRTATGRSPRRWRSCCS
jgi:putrescine transport system permease protein